MGKRPDQATAATRPYAGTDIALGGQGTNARKFRWDWLAADVFDALYLKLTGNQTVAGTKTFSNAPVFPASGAFFGSSAISETDINVLDQADNGTLIGAVPAVSGLACAIRRQGDDFWLTFTLTEVEVAVTDAGASGSFGSIKIFDFVQAAVGFLLTRQNYTSFIEGAALTTAAGDAVFEIGIGTTSISGAADGTLGNGTHENVGQAVSITLSGGTGAGTAVDGAKATAHDGTTTAIDLYLNISGSAATIDASSTLDVSGTIAVRGSLAGDD